jgi:hypothetical protein
VDDDESTVDDEATAVELDESVAVDDETAVDDESAAVEDDESAVDDDDDCACTLIDMAMSAASTKKAKKTRVERRMVVEWRQRMGLRCRLVASVLVQ